MKSMCLADFFFFAYMRWKVCMKWAACNYNPRLCDSVRDRVCFCVCVCVCVCVREWQRASEWAQPYWSTLQTERQINWKCLRYPDSAVTLSTGQTFITKSLEHTFAHTPIPLLVLPGLMLRTHSCRAVLSNTTGYVKADKMHTHTHRKVDKHLETHPPSPPPTHTHTHTHTNKHTHTHTG